MYYFRHGKLLKVTSINGKYSVRYKSYLGSEEVHFIHFGVKEFFQDAIPLNAYGQMMMSFRGL